jgi:hypothetical protein
VAVSSAVGLGGSTRIVDGTQSFDSLVVVGSGVGVISVVSVDFSVVLGCSVLAGVGVGVVVGATGVGVFVELRLTWLVGTSVGFDELMRGVEDEADGMEDPVEPIGVTAPLVAVGTPGLVSEPDGPGVNV